MPPGDSGDTAKKDFRKRSSKRNPQGKSGMNSPNEREGCPGRIPCAMPEGWDVVALPLRARGPSPCRPALVATLEPATPVQCNASSSHPAQAAQDHHGCEPHAGKHRGPLRPVYSSRLHPLLPLPLRQLSANVGAHVPIYSKGQGTIQGVACSMARVPRGADVSPPDKSLRHSDISVTDPAGSLRGRRWRIAKHQLVNRHGANFRNPS